MSTSVSFVAANRNGYVYLIMVLFVGIIALTVLGSYMLLSVTALQSSRTVYLSMQALGNANTCAERALLSLQNNLDYAGDETFPLTEGSCVLEAIGGSGSQDRTICATGTVGTITRRLEIMVNAVLPAAAIESWREVTSFTQC